MFKNKKVFLFALLFVTVTLLRANNPPVAVKDVATADQDITLTIPSGAPDFYLNLLDNDSDPDGDVIAITRFTVDGGATWIAAGGTDTTAGGAVTINADGTYTFVPTASFNGVVTDIIYEIIDDDLIDPMTAMNVLYLTVEMTADDLLEIKSFSSCNQGFTADGDYKIKYQITFQNTSETRGYHENSEITNIQLVENLNAIFGDCITQIDKTSLSVNAGDDFIDNAQNYPVEWNNLNYDDLEFNESDATPGAQGIFDTPTAKLYPRQTISLDFCIYVNPFCGGRPNPTPSGSGIDFDNLISITSNRGNASETLRITDFHTAESTVSAGFFMTDLVNDVVSEPPVQPDQSFDYSHRIILLNDGSAQANNVNFNLGLRNFLNQGVIFNTIGITQISGPAVTINGSYNGDTETLILTNGNSLNAGESIILEIHYIISPAGAVNSTMYFSQLLTSMTQGLADGQGSVLPLTFVDELDNSEKSLYSFVAWSDALGNHLDRYYKASTGVSLPSSNDQCTCEILGMRLPQTMTASLLKTGIVTNDAYNGIKEHKELTFEFTLTNTSNNLQEENIQIQDNLNLICGGSNIISVSAPIIFDTTATTNPIINPSYDGLTDFNFFDGSSGLLLAEVITPATPAEYIKVQVVVVIADDCFGINTANCSVSDHLNLTPVSVNSNDLNISVFTDDDSDGVTNLNDIDDDNDGILDFVEHDGLNPLDDHDSDTVPNYEDTDFGVDINGDGIIDLFDFDMDGVANHFDLDSDNDGIYDIIEAGGIDSDNNGLVPVNSSGILLIDADFDGLTDSLLVDTDNNGTADIPVDVDVAGGVDIPNHDTDTDTHPNALDIDSDDDGVVDNIEAQLSDNYIVPNATADINGVVYGTGLIPIDTDNSSIPNDKIPDYIDSDSDDDLRDDSIEAWDIDNDGVADTIFSTIDNDNDGLDNNYDNDDTQINPTNNNQLATNFPNEDNAFTTELDWRERPAIIVMLNKDTKVEGVGLDFVMKLVTMNSYIDYINDGTEDTSLLVSKASTTDVTVDYVTLDGTPTVPVTYKVAMAPYDYTQATSTSITLLAGTDTDTVSVPTFDDNIDELTELMFLNIKVTSNNTINPVTHEFETDVDSEVVGEIIDNDSPPNIIMNNSRAIEGIDLDYKVELSHPSSRPTIIDVSTSDLSATSPDDYTNLLNEIVTINGTDDPNNSNLEIDFNITTIEDDLNEPFEERLKVIGAVTSVNINNQDLNKIGIIEDKDPGPTVTITNPTIIEGGTLTFEINLSPADYLDVNMNIFTNDDTAREPEDYTTVLTQITMPANTRSYLVEVTTIDDILVEEIERLVLNGIVTTSNTQNIEVDGIGSIIDNDFPNLFSPNNDSVSDVFEIVSVMPYPNFKLQIFDRLGSVVYDYENNGNPNPLWWDGTMNGNPLPEGVYYYTLDYNNGITTPKSGFIQLIR